MKILHVAAFEGNIGDNASHKGFYSILDNILNSYSVDKLEIRKAYKNYKESDKLEFDGYFSNIANDYDILIFGGGGFLDYWVPNSSNGTTLDISEDVLETINIPILISSIGSNPNRSVPDGNEAKFKSFLEYQQSNDKFDIFFRNDGSINSIRNNISSRLSENYKEILDHGFFYEAKDFYHNNKFGRYCVINITLDQLQMSGINDDESWYIEGIKKVLFKINSLGLHIVFVSHIHQDIIAISKLLDKLPTDFVRKNTSIAGCYQGDGAMDDIFSIYKNSELVIASRYHANVVAMTSGTPVIGLSPLKRISYIHEQLGSENYSVEINQGFDDKVIRLIEDREALLKNSKVILENIRYKKLETLNIYKDYFKKIDSKNVK